MDFLTALVLGAIQGFFEWLPVSSEAVISLYLTQIAGKTPIESVNTAVYLHTGTMLAALIYFRQDFIEVFRELPEYVREASRQKSVPQGYALINFLMVSTLVTGIVGGSLYLFGLKYLPSSPEVFTGLIGVFLLVTGVMKLKGSEASRIIEDAGWRDSVFVGFLQGFSIIPGVSRSGSTVFGLFFQDFSSDDAFRLSFLMSVPAILAAQIGINIFSGFSLSQGLVVAAFSAFVVGYVSIDAILRLAERTEVAYLCFALAALSFLAILL